MNRRMIGLTVVLVVLAGAAMGWAQTNLTVVRHSDNTLWKMTCEGTSSCSAWTQITGGFTVQPTLAWDQTLNKYILIGIGNNMSNIWRSTFNEDGTWNNDWTLIGTGATGSPSPVAVSGAYLGGTLDPSKIYMNTCTGVNSCGCKATSDILLSGGGSCPSPSGFQVFLLASSTPCQTISGGIITHLWCVNCEMANADTATGWASSLPASITVTCITP